MVIHSYRHRFGGVAGDPAYEAIERRLAEQPAITPDAFLLYGTDDGVTPPPSAEGESHHFPGRSEQRFIPGVGHNVPQEAPDAFANAVLALT